MQSTLFRKERYLDVVLCIDATSSMGPCIENVKRNAKKFYSELRTEMETTYSSDVSGLRVQLIVFRDLESDVEALEKSPFFELPEDNDDFEKYLSGIVPRGGGDVKESGLEALYTAMKTDWTARGSNDRQIIVLFSDSDAIAFGEKSRRTGYPDLVNEKDFLNTWGCALGNANTISERCKRLVLFAPKNSFYETRIVPRLNRSQFIAVNPLEGMADIDFSVIIKTICASASNGGL